ncbi:hypothetical protein J5N97_001168 [Dioscorea zingiberensis]|uniref:Riboflavin synthase n=1 Tax=Dioscorea zingiberensis TaxID=325984 RepID=A0A9D5BUP0_9LILI|nr:hypothetical protein J5N97_001168 [Dioscorea zingiberensis]
MGGHFVQGHVDGTGEIVSMVPEGDSLWVKVQAAPEILRYVVPKGFITVDGTSLTVVRVYEEECCFDFMLVAYTQQKVVVPLKKVGEKVNLEVWIYTWSGHLDCWVTVVLYMSMLPLRDCAGGVGH